MCYIFCTIAMTHLIPYCPLSLPGGGGHSPEKMVWVCAALKTPFSRLSCRSQDPRLRPKSVHKTLIWKINVNFCLQNQQFSENMAIFSSRSSNLTSIFVKKLRNLKNYQLSNLCFWWKSAHKLPLSRQFIHSQAPGSEIRTYLPEKKVWVPSRVSLIPCTESTCTKS